jgi:hypothetical protein
MFRGSMRLAVNQWGKVEEAEPNQDFQVKVNTGLWAISICTFTMMCHSVVNCAYADGGQHVFD